MSTELEILKELFIMLWSQQGRSAFPRSLREEYINRLWSMDEESRKTLRKSELLGNHESTDALEKFLTFDPNLTIFLEYARRYDRLSPKAFNMVKLPSIAPTDVQLLKKFPAKAWQPTKISQDWTITEVEQRPSSTLLVASRRSAKVMTAKIPRDKLNETWPILSNEVKEYMHSNENKLEEVHVVVSAPYKVQVAVEIDWDQGSADISSDIAEWDEIDGKTKAQQRETIKSQALGHIAKEVGLRISAPTFMSLASDGNPVDTDLPKKIDHRVSLDSLFIIRGGSYEVPEDERNNAEDVDVHLKFETDVAREIAESHFDTHGTFDNFFELNRRFDRRRTKVQGDALAAFDHLDCKGVFLKVFNSSEPADPDDDGKMAGKTIEAVAFEFQKNSKEWIIRTPDYSGRVRDAFVSELHRLSAKPIRHAAPVIGDPE